MSVSLYEITKLSSLARLHFSDDDLVIMQSDMNGIIDLFNKLASIQSEDISPDESLFPQLSHVAELRSGNYHHDDTLLDNVSHDKKDNGIVVSTSY